MPSSIPYDPSLTLMSVVNEQALNNVTEITALQAPVNAAQDALNSLISSKRSLTMTKTELKNLGIGTDQLDKELDKLDIAVEKAASDYAKAKITAEPQIAEKRKNIVSVHKKIESPVDYSRSEIKTMPITNDTMNMDVQYFSYDSKSQSADAYSNQIATYVSRSVDVLGNKQAATMGTAASRQVSRQVSSHSIEGTLVLSVSCTHKNASIVAPFVPHVDKAIKVWNSLFPGSKLDPTSSSSMMKCATNESQQDKEKFSIISGATYGSSFVGMVHILSSSSSTISETMAATAASMHASMNAGGWFAKRSGKVGVDSKFASDVKNLLSQQNVQPHATVLTIGVTPSMVANEISNAVEKLPRFDSAFNMEAVAAMRNANASDQDSVQFMAEASRTRGQASEVPGKAIESALAIIDDSKNKFLDVSSMMAALDDYLKKASEGAGGFMSIKYDDSEGGGPAEGGEEKATL
ncbi:hypothetical protein F53441_9516 [Fusarium austroafricanum]|uniref:Uncharacterized protein n=1 Tax=Fusarium austroafricanum TaxID=2364996 RepID=A0A8H4KAV0_9HYPO|nr:hypothetical protein F53441_9516 [Fusarium austroafricanum]